MMDAKAVPSLCMALSLAQGCADEGRASSTVTITDSAGIEIVESVAPAWAAGQEWSVDTTPLMSIGEGERPEKQFYRVVGVARLLDGRVVVADAGSQKIRLFASDGRFLSSMGGPGEGPGEFTDLKHIAVLAGDSILAYNGVPPRVTIFGPDGTVARTTQVPYPVEQGYADLEAVGVLDDGRIVAYRSLDYLSIDFVDGLNREPLALRLLDPWTGRLDTLGPVPGIERMLLRRGGGVRQTILPFGRFPDIAARDMLVYVAPNDDFAVHVLSPSGAVERIVRAAQRPRPIEDPHLTQYMDNRVAGASDAQTREYRQLVRSMPVPETFPPYRGIEVDLLGNLWVADYAWPLDTPPLYTVFSAEGAMLGSVTLPRDFAIPPGRWSRPSWR